MMDVTAVNWGLLDQMVIDYCRAEGVFHDEEEVRDEGNWNGSSRRTINQIRSLIERGCITDAVNLITQHAATLLQDQRFLFWLYKQHFIEMLRRGGNAARLQAIECSRAQLGPCALNAYPEAYEEFKRVLLALIYDSDYQNSPVAEEWGEAKRSNLAATVASTLKAQLQTEEPLFSLTLRYLLSVHNAYCMRKNIVSPISDLAGEMLSKERDPPPALQDSCTEVPVFNEVDVQALAQAAELPRQDAVQSLRYTRGDVMAALKSELSRIRLNTDIADKLVWEYCVYRGLIDNGPGCCSSSEACPSMDEDKSNSPPSSTSKTVEQQTAKPEDCTSIVKRYRWKGRTHSDGERQVPESQDVEMVPADDTEPDDAAVDKYRRSVQIRQLITERKVSEAIKEVQLLDAKFFEEHPQLLFQLKQISFCAFLEAGDHARALELAREDLGPLAARYEAQLLKPMKETLWSLACKPGEVELVSPAGLAATIQLTLSTSLGIMEPQLMKVIRTCLSNHTEWFKVQMCSDPFADLLNINQLKEREGSISKQTTKKTDDGTPGQQPGTNAPDEKPPFDESSILTIMEWMALPRGDAIQLLAEYEGSVDEVFAQLMG